MTQEYYSSHTIIDCSTPHGFKDFNSTERAIMTNFGYSNVRDCLGFVGLATGVIFKTEESITMANGQLFPEGTYKVTRDPHQTKANEVGFEVSVLSEDQKTWSPFPEAFCLGLFTPCALGILSYPKVNASPGFSTIPSNCMGSGILVEDRFAPKVATPYYKNGKPIPLKATDLSLLKPSN